MPQTSAKSRKKPVKKRKLNFWSNSSGRAKIVIVALLVGICGTVAVLASHAGTGVRIAIVGDATGRGYWVAASDGGVFTQGDAPFYGSMGSTTLAAPIVGMAATSDHQGYYLVGKDGGVFAFGDAKYQGSLPGSKVSVDNIVGIAVDSVTGGYWLVGSDGGVFSYNAPFYGSMGGKPLNKPVVGMTASADDKGYWLAAADGGVFTFGDAPFYGSMGGKTLNAPVSGIARQGNTNNYWLVAQDGGIFTFNAGFYGSTANVKLNAPVMGMAPTPVVAGTSVQGNGYWLVGADGGVFTFGDAIFEGTPPQVNPTTVTTGALPKPVCVGITAPVNVAARSVTIQGVSMEPNGNPYKDTLVSWGDGVSATAANASGLTHVYGYGTFTLVITPHFTVYNQDFAATSTTCQEQFTFSAPKPVVTTSPQTGGTPSGGAAATVTNTATTTAGAGTDGCAGLSGKVLQLCRENQDGSGSNDPCAGLSGKVLQLCRENDGDGSYTVTPAPVTTSSSNSAPNPIIDCTYRNNQGTIIVQQMYQSDCQAFTTPAFPQGSFVS